jgi:hypothetical protein
LDKFSSRLAPTHYILLTVKKYLADLYGVVKGYAYNELPEEKSERKINFLTEFIATLEKVDEGYPKVRCLS